MMKTEKPLQSPSAPALSFQKFGKLLKSVFKPRLKTRAHAKAGLEPSPTTAFKSAKEPRIKAQKLPKTAQQLSSTLNECGLYL